MSTFSDEPARFWHPWCSDSSKYAVGIDHKVSCKNERSGFVQSLSANRRDWGCLLQSVDAYEYRGKRISFSAQVKTLEVNGEAGIFSMVVAADQAILLHDAMTDRFLSGSVDWTSCNVVLDVPENARYIKFGAILVGSGRVWIDDLAFNQVDLDKPTTDRRFSVNSNHENTTNIDLSHSFLKTDFNNSNLLRPTGWVTTTKGPSSYELGIDPNLSEDISSFCIKSELKQKNENEQEIQSQAWLTQYIVAIDFRRKRLRFSAFIKTEDVVGWCGLMMSVKGAMNTTIAHTDMCRRALSGTHDWVEYSIVLDAPETTYYATVSATLHGRGRAWFSRFSLEEVTTEIPTTDRDSEPSNLDFAIEY